MEDPSTLNDRGVALSDAGRYEEAIAAFDKALKLAPGNTGLVYNRGEGDPDKVALSLLPLYYARKATMLRELEGRPWTAVEDSIRAQAEGFFTSKDYLVDRWISYLPWAPSRM